MNCPYCNTQIKDGVEVCPACRRRISNEVNEGMGSVAFCKQCGARLGKDDITCPSCGMYRDKSEIAPPISNINLPELDPSATNTLPRIESAIPDEDAESERTSTPIKPFAVAGALAVVVVTVFTLIITHPWNPAAYYGRPQEPLDFTKSDHAQIDSLSGQDKKAQSEEMLTNADPYEILSTAYDRIIELAGQVDDIQLKFRDYGFSDSQEEIDEAAKQTKLVAIEISNEISKLNNLNFGGTKYESQRVELIKLANFLRNRIDGYSSAWNATKNSSNREADRSKIESYIQKARANQASFDDIKIQVKPQKIEE